MAKLTPKRLLFVDEYLVDLNGCKAAIRAGYSPNSACSEATSLLKLPEIRELLNRKMAERAARTQTDADRVIEELKRLCFSTIDDYDVDPFSGTITLKHTGEIILPSDEAISEERRAELIAEAKEKATRKLGAIAGVKRSVTISGKGEDVETTYHTEYKLWDKPGSLRTLMQHLGMLIDRAGQVDRNGKLTDPPTPVNTILVVREEAE